MSLKSHIAVTLVALATIPLVVVPSGTLRGDAGSLAARLFDHPIEAADRGTRKVGPSTATILASSSQAAGTGERPASTFEPYRLGVFPYAHVLTIDRIYGPLAAQLAEDLGRPVLVKTKSTDKDFAQELQEEAYEILVVHGFYYVEAVDSLHYLPLARLDKPPMCASVLVRKDDPAKVPSDLVGRTISLPPEFSGIGRLVEGALIEHGLAPSDVVLQRQVSGRACLQALAMGAVDACAGPDFMTSQFNLKHELGLRTLFESRRVSNMVIAAHSRIPEGERERILRSILAWSESPNATAILPGGPWKRFVPAKDSDYDDFRYYVSELRPFAER